MRFLCLYLFAPSTSTSINISLRRPQQSRSTFNTTTTSISALQPPFTSTKMRSAATIAGLLALAASTLADTGFTLHAFSTRSKDLVHWAVVNAHVGAGQTVLTVQRPTAYQSDLAVIRGTDRQKRNQKGRLQFGEWRSCRREEGGSTLLC